MYNMSFDKYNFRITYFNISMKEDLIKSKLKKFLHWTIRSSFQFITGFFNTDCPSDFVPMAFVIYTCVLSSIDEERLVEAENKKKKEKEGRRSRRGKWNYVEARWSNVSVSVRDPFFLFFEVCFLRFQRSNRLETGVAESRKIFMIHCNSTTFPFFLFFFKSMYVVIVLYFSKNDSISLRNSVWRYIWSWENSS